MKVEVAYSEEEIVKGCAQNKRKYQEALYRRYFATMMRMCNRYTSDEMVAVSICNDGFLKVFKKIDSFAFKGSLEGWIRRIVFHSLSDHFRRESKYIQFMVFEERENQEGPEILPGLYLEDLLELIKQLPRMTEKVFRLYAIEGYNHREIGERLGMSENTSKWHLSSARKKLQELLRLQQKNYASEQ